MFSVTLNLVPFLSQLNSCQLKYFILYYNYINCLFILNIQLSLFRSRKEKLNAQSRQSVENPSDVTHHFTRAQVHHDGSRQVKTERVAIDETELSDVASGFQAQILPQQSYSPQANQIYQHNLIQCQSNRGSSRETKCSRSDPRFVQRQIINNYNTEQCLEQDGAPRGCNKKQPIDRKTYCVVNNNQVEFPASEVEGRRSGNKRNYFEITTKEAKVSQTNYQNEPQLTEAFSDVDMISSDTIRPINLVNIEYMPSTVRGKRLPRNLNSSSEEGNRNCVDGGCPYAANKGVRKKECSIKESPKSDLK